MRATDAGMPDAADRTDGPPAVPAAAPAAPLEASEATAALFERAVRLHSRRLLAIARAIAGNRAAAEDVVQQALMNLYQHRDRYDWREPGGLLRRSVVNEALRLLRQPRMAPVADDYPDGGSGRRGDHDGSGDGGTPVGGMIGRETVQRVRAAIDRLPEHFRAALVLCEYENMSYAQIAEVLGASVPQVKTWLHRGRRQLGEMLKDFVQAERRTPRASSAGPSPRRVIRPRGDEPEELPPPTLAFIRPAAEGPGDGVTSAGG